MGELPGNTELADDFRDCIAALNTRAVVFVLVGGFAVGWHGVVRATGDIDFLYKQDPENVARLCKALEDFGAPRHFIDPAFLLSANAVTQIGNPPLRIDLLSAISGVGFHAVRAGAIATELAGERLLIIGLAELLANKRATGRARDRDDVRRLRAAARTKRQREG